MNCKNINEIFFLNNSYQTWIVEDTKMKFLHSKSLLEKFSVVYEIELDKLPYRLNLLDDLATNENAHSKFLIRLLNYQPALIDFLTFINNNKSPFFFDVNTIHKPILTYEKMRIDGLIKENNKFAIIIENKIHGATEQEQQIGRYIDKCRSIGFKVEQIYVLYITRTKYDNHTDETWGNYNQENFKNRYSKLSYKSEILSWLESYLKVLSPKEELIKSAVVQYIDHLKHLFNNTEIYSNMNAELQSFLTKELDLGTDNAENIQVVNKKINEINELNKHLKELANNSINNLFKEWQNNIKENLNFEGKQNFIQSDSSFIKTGVVFNYKGYFFSISIEYNFRSIYCGIGRHHASQELHPGIKELLDPLLKTEGLREEMPWWYGWKYTSFSDAYYDFEYLVKITLERVNSMK